MRFADNVPADLAHLSGAQFDKLLPSGTDDTQTCDGCIDGTGCKLVYLTDDQQVVYVRFEMADGSEIDLDVDLFRPRIVQDELFQVQLGLADLAHIAENMCSHAVQRIASARGADQFQFGQLLAVGL